MVLSYIIPVRNDAERLRLCLQSIRASAGDIPSEIIIGDNGSTDESAVAGRAAGARVLDLPDRRVAQVRNEAAQAARGEFLAFVDADHVLDAGWARAAVDVLRDPSVSAVGAQYRTPLDGTWVQQTFDCMRRHQPGNRSVEWLPSGNLVVRRRVFEQLGGFDVSLETCEDVDLCQRIVQGGGRLLAVEALRSVHLGDPPTLRTLFLAELWRGRDNLRVSLRVPLTLARIPSVAAPIVVLAGLVAIPAGMLFWGAGGSYLAALGLAALVGLFLVRAAALLMHAPADARGARLALQGFALASVYETARALAIVARTGYHTIGRSGASRP
jgi:hypothetical protein